MFDLSIFLMASALVRCVTIICVTHLVLELRNPWLALLYLLVPMVSAYTSDADEEVSKDEEQQ